VAVKPPTRVGVAVVIPTGWRFQFKSAPDGALRLLRYTCPPWPSADEAEAAESGGLGEPTV